MHGTETLRREMVIAGRQLEAALQQEHDVNRPRWKANPDSLLLEWKAARRLVDRRTQEYLGAVRRYRAAVEEWYDFSDSVTYEPDGSPHPVKI